MEEMLIYIKNYEIGLLKKIKKYIFSSHFNNPIKLKEATNLWYKDKEKCKKIYGHISYWDTSEIICMSGLFYKFTNFNHESNGAVSHKQRIVRLKFNNAVAPYLYNYNVECSNRNPKCFQSYYKNKEKDPQRCRPKRIKGKSLNSICLF